MNATDVAEALRALGFDAIAEGDYLATLRTVLVAAQRRRMDAVHTAVALDRVAPRPGATWRPVCCWCVDALEVALGGRDVEAHRVNLDTKHDTGCCSCCPVQGRDVLVASIPDDVFADPPQRFAEIRGLSRSPLAPG